LPQTLISSDLDFWANKEPEKINTNDITENKIIFFIV